MPYPPFTRECWILGDIRHTRVLTPFCRACRRRGRYSVARLIERHGADHPILSWQMALERACPRWTPQAGRPCNVMVDELLRRFQGMGPAGLDDEPL